MNDDQTAPESTEQPAASGNVSVMEFAQRLGSRRRETLASATATTPTPEPAPDSELEPATEGEQADGAATVSQTTDAGSEEQPAVPAASNLDQEILDAIREAGVEPTQAAAVAKMAKRIKTLVDDRDRERNRRLELERAGQPNETQEPEANRQQAEPPVNDAVQRIEAEIGKMRAALKTIAQNPDGYEVKDNDGNVVQTLSPEQLNEIRLDAESKLAELNAEKRIVQRELQQKLESEREAATSLAVREYPWVNNKQAPEYQLAITELRQLGPVAAELRKSPAFALIVGRYIRGLQAEQAAAAQAAVRPAQGRPAQSRVPPAVVPGTSTRAKANPLAGQIKAAEERMARTGGSPEAYAQLRSLRRKAAQQAA